MTPHERLSLSAETPFDRRSRRTPGIASARAGMVSMTCALASVVALFGVLAFCIWLSVMHIAPTGKALGLLFLLAVLLQLIAIVAGVVGWRSLTGRLGFLIGGVLALATSALFIAGVSLLARHR